MTFFLPTVKKIYEDVLIVNACLRVSKQLRQDV